MESDDIAVLRIPGTSHQFFINMAYLMAIASSNTEVHMAEFTLDVRVQGYKDPLHRINFVRHLVPDHNDTWWSMLHIVGSPITYHLYQPGTKLNLNQRRALYDMLTCDKNCSAVRLLF